MSTFRDQQVEEANQLARRMRALKWVVIILGVLLVIAMITTVAGIIYKSRHASAGAEGTSPSATQLPQASGFGSATLPVPTECQIASATASGDRLIVVTSGPADHCRLVIVADLKSGRLVGQFSYPAP